MIRIEETEPLNFIETGGINWAPINKNFTNLNTDLKNIAEHLNFLLASGTYTVNVLATCEGELEIMAARRHGGVRVKSAYARLGDNSPVEISADFDNDTLTFTDTEKAGKTRSFRIDKNKKYHFYEPIILQHRGNRNVEYFFTFESVEQVPGV